MTYAPVNTHKFVGHDYDSEELQICRIYGESQWGVSGSTPLGAKILLAENKSEDFHSLTAKIAGVSRSAAKQGNYAIFYGGGKKAVLVAIRLWHPEFDVNEAQKIAGVLIKALRGTKDLGSDQFYGGIGSAAFNRMNELASQQRPATPVLGSSIAPSSWVSNNADGRVNPGLVNFMVQGAASSFGVLSCTLVGTHYLFKKYGIDHRFAYSAHDEYGFLIKKEQAVQAAYLEQVNHAWVWSLVHYMSGVHDIPTDATFASSINVDRVWRKEANADVATPTFENIEPGDEYTMDQLLDIAEENNFWGMLDTDK